MNAVEARSKANEINFTKVKNELSNIKRIISEAVTKGEFETDVFGTITKENIKLLKQEGFNVRSYSSGLNETSTEISW
jgi:hypothetical protein